MAREYDVVFDTQGGETLLRSSSWVRPGGRRDSRHRSVSCSPAEPFFLAEDATDS